MNRKLWIGSWIVVWSCLTAAADSPPPTTAPAKAPEESVRELKAQVERSLSSQTPEQLRKAIRKQGAELLASFDHDWKIEIVVAQEDLLREQRIEQKGAMDQAKTDYIEVKKLLETEMARVRSELGPGEATERSLVAIIQKYRPRLQVAKDEEKASRLALEKTDALLARLRHERIRLESERRLAVVCSATRDAGTVTVEGSLVDFSLIFSDSPKTVAAATSRPSETLADALKSLESIEKQ